MKRVRIKFQKKGDMVYISHLDLMRCISRAFVRAGIPIYHTEGFNPHPHMVFSPPISLGFTGLEELLEIQVPEATGLMEIQENMNHELPRGLSFLEVYEPESKMTEIKNAAYRVWFPERITPEQRDLLTVFLERDSILVMKKSKKGIKEVDIAPMLKKFEWDCDGTSLYLALSCADPQTLNPELLMTAALSETGIQLKNLRFQRECFLNEQLTKFH